MEKISGQHLVFDFLFVFEDLTSSAPSSGALDIMNRESREVGWYGTDSSLQFNNRE